VPNPSVSEPNLRSLLDSLPTKGRLFDVARHFGVSVPQKGTKVELAGLLALSPQLGTRAVLDAYGWTDVAVPPYCPKNDAERAAVKVLEDEVIDRLFMLNAERAAQERGANDVRAITTAKAKAKRTTKTEATGPAKGAKNKTSKKTAEGQGSLF
jgi:hypothetical protein